MKKYRFSYLVAFITLIILDILALHAWGGSECKDGTNSGAIEVKIVDCIHNDPLSGVSVVLGDSTGAMVTTGETNANGIIIFSNVPANATITAAYSYTDIWGDIEYILKSIAEVNVDTVTICMAYGSSDAKIVGEVNVTVTNVPANMSCWEVKPTGDYIDSGDTTETITIYEYDMQKDGKLTLLVCGYNQNDDLISYGVARDISFPTNQTTIDQVIDISKTNFSQMLITAENIPVNTAYMGLAVGFERQGVFYYGEDEYFEAPINATVVEAFNLVPGLWDYYFVNAITIIGEDAFQSLGMKMPTLSDPTFNFNDALALPDNISITNAYSETPTLNWSGGATASDLIHIVFFSFQNEDFYCLCMEMPANRKNITIPELPDTLASFRPNNWELDYLNAITYSDFSFINGWQDYLSFMNNYYSGTGIIPNSFTERISGRLFIFSDTAYDTKAIIMKKDFSKILPKG